MKHQFDLNRVSSRVHGFLQAVEQAAMACGEATDDEEFATAFSHLSMARQALYEYVEELESEFSNIMRNITLRF